MIGSTVGAVSQIGPAKTDALQKEMALTDMGLSAVYMHELRFRKKVYWNQMMVHDALPISGFCITADNHFLWLFLQHHMDSSVSDKRGTSHFEEDPPIPPQSGIV